MQPFKNNKKKNPQNSQNLQNLQNPPSQGSFGALFPNQHKKNPRAPNLMGHLDIDNELLEQLMSLYDGGESIRLQVSAWKKQASVQYLKCHSPVFAKLLFSLIVWIKQLRNLRDNFSILTSNEFFQ